jgi:isopropylmalate/homocitrate/citramalate synthase
MRTVILDTTLREGELFRMFGSDVKAQIAGRLAEIGVGRIELTVDYPPRTTESDLRPVLDELRRRGVEVILHGRAYDEDLKSMAKYEVQGCALYMSLSQLHLEYKLHGLSYEKALGRLLESVEKARAMGFRYVRATLEDVSRIYLSEGVDKIVDAAERLRKAGATIVSIPDTAGLLSPRMASEMVRAIKNRTDVPLAAHFHNDYGMASANTVEAVLEGVEEAHVSIMGIGDRNGIADLYEVVSTLEDIHGLKTGVERGSLRALYQFFARITGVKLHWRHPLSEEARTIRAGVHQAMAVKKPEGYMPEGKLRHDFIAPTYNLSPYVSHRLVSTILGGGRSDEEVRRITNLLAEVAKANSGVLSMAKARELIKRETGLDIEPSYLEKFMAGERVYVLAKLNPRFPADEIVRDLRRWDEVESVDEVYGDADIVITGRMSYSSDNFVNRLKQKYGSALENLKVLMTD